MDRRAYDAWIDSLVAACAASQSLHPCHDERVRGVLAQGAQFVAPIAPDIRQDDEPPNWMGW